MNATTIGVDLAKHVFAVCEGDSRGHGARSSVMKRGEFFEVVVHAAGRYSGGDGSV